MAQFRDKVYKWWVGDWSCTLNACGVMVANGSVVNQSGQTLNNVRINLRIADIQVTALNGMPNRRAYGSDSAPMVVRSLANVASSRFEVQVKPSQSRNVQCQIWFRGLHIAHIPTWVPRQ